MTVQPAEHPEPGQPPALRSEGSAEGEPVVLRDAIAAWLDRLPEVPELTP